jgi:Tfp pilus assembly protein PilF
MTDCKLRTIMPPATFQAERKRASAFLYPMGFLCLFFLFAQTAKAVELDDARKQFVKGDYQDCIKTCQQAIEDAEYGEEWRLLLIQSFMAVGQYPKAQEALTNNLSRYFSSIQMKVLGHEVFQKNGDAEKAKEQFQDINYLVGTRGWAYTDAPNLVALAKTALLAGEDPKLVLTRLLDRAKKADPTYRETYLVSGWLALNKQDYELAAKTFGEGVKRFKGDPDMHYGLAEAFSSSDRRRMLKEIESALDVNTNHIPTRLLLVEHLIDGEEYEEANRLLEGVLKVNPWHSKAWAFKAVMAHLKGDTKTETEAREKGLKFWNTNPEVEHMLGKKLSQKYRFTEGASYQRAALKKDENYLPAKIQLAQDLLRLGDEQEGWQLASSVHEEDGYDVTAYNLMNLKDTLAKFQTLTNADFVVRMAPKEAGIYGERALALLQQAKDELCKKYGLDLKQQVVVEIFNDSKDFGVRTFGMPDNPGYLGVCFGRVITANSPATQINPANWEAVLWHEFCHVVTLNLTRNKMPRWLSEGISVYEERKKDPSWGQTMRPRYRKMILEDELTPVGELSSAFLAPKSDLHLQFAYYESYLVIEFLVEKYGLDKLHAILKDLGNGVEINKSIASHTSSIEAIEKEFEAFAKKQAEELGPGLDWTEPKFGSLEKMQADLGKKSSTNYYAMLKQAQKALDSKDWKGAKAPLEKVIELCPVSIGPESPYLMLAHAHRELKELEAEKSVLDKLAKMDSQAVDAYKRLLEIASGEKNWKSVKENGERYLAVNPLSSVPYKFLAQAEEALEQPRDAVRSYRTMLQLDPEDPSEVHYRLARQLFKLNEPDAQRQVLQALEEAPRFRDAQKLLLEINRTQKPKAPTNE